MVKWQGIRGVFGERMKGENEDETCFGMGDISGAAKRGFQQWVAGHAAVGVAAIRWVKHKSSDPSNPRIRKNIRQSCGITSFDGGVFWPISTVGPSKVGIGSLHHFRMNVDADGVSSAQ